MKRTMSMKHQYSTIILAGGASQRMGCDKATLPWQNTTLISYLAQLVTAKSKQTVIVASDQQKISISSKHVIIVHDESPFPGPLLGLCYGLRSVLPEVPAFVTGCDYPLLTADIPGFLLQHLGSADVCLLKRASFRQPLPGLYHPRILSKLDVLIREGARSLQALLDVVEVVQVDETDWNCHFSPEVFLNMNTPADYELALLRFTERSMMTDQASKRGQ